MKLRCTIDGLLLDAEFGADSAALIVYDGDESFALEAVEALFYEIVQATADERLQLERVGYRLLRFADDYGAGPTCDLPSPLPAVLAPR